MDTAREPSAGTLVELHHEVDFRMRNGDSFSSVEDEVIEPSGLSAEEKSALWLYGWSFVDWRAQRREASAHIVQLSEDPGAVVCGPSTGGRPIRPSGRLAARGRRPLPPDQERCDWRS